MAANFEDNLLSDDPLAELDDELFGRSHLVERVIDVLGHVRKQSPSSTVGLVGAWGSGKSSILTNVVSQIRMPNAQTSAALGKKWLVAEFNPWLFADSHALHAGFFTTLRDAFPKSMKWRDVRTKVTKLGRYVAPATGVVTAFLGGDGETPASNLIDQFERSAVEYHAAISAKLESVKQPVLIVVDDLDRLTAAELLDVFKLVRLVGRLPHVYYLLSYDEHTLVDLLAKTDLVSANDDRRALEYLEKIVQVRLDMPLLRPFEIDRVIDRVLAFIAQKHRVTFDEDIIQTLARRFDDVMSKRLRTPRSIKRLFGQIDAFLPSVGNEVHFGDYVVVTWLRTMEPGVYDLIQRRRHRLLGIETDEERSLDAPESALAQEREEWLKALAHAHVAENDTEDVLWLLSTLFPSLGIIYRLGESPHGGVAQAPQPGRVAHADYFDRFFSFCVPADDIPDAVARDGLAQIVDGDSNGDMAQRLLTAYSRDAHLALRKITQSYESTRSSSPALVLWTVDRWMRASDPLLRGRIETLAAEFLSGLPPADVKSVSETMVTTDQGLLLASHLRAIMRRPSYARRAARDTLDAAADALSSVLDTRLPLRFGALSEEYSSPRALPEELQVVAMRWRFSEPDGMRAFLATIVPERWGWLDCLMWLAPVSTVDGGQTYLLSASTSPAPYFKLLDVDTATHDLESELAAAPTLEELPEEAEATEDLRRKYALATLRRNAELNAEIAAEGTRSSH